jgi:hypothetical protein
MRRDSRLSSSGVAKKGVSPTVIFVLGFVLVLFVGINPDLSPIINWLLM